MTATEKSRGQKLEARGQKNNQSTINHRQLKSYRRRRGGLQPDKYLADEQVDRVLRDVCGRAAAAPNSRRHATNRFVVLMLLYSGLRASELLDVEIRDCPLVHGKPVIDVPDGKGSIGRTVDIKAALAEQIAQYVRRWRKGAKPTSSLIASEAGYRRLVVRRKRQRGDGAQVVVRSCRMGYQCLYERVRRIGQRAGVGRLTPHMFRHTYLTQAYGESKDLRWVQDQAGHRSPVTTAIYAQTARSVRREYVERVKWPEWLAKT